MRRTPGGTRTRIDPLTVLGIRRPVRYRGLVLLCILALTGCATPTAEAEPPEYARTAAATTDLLPELPRFSTVGTITGADFDPYLTYDLINVHTIPTDAAGLTVWRDRQGVRHNHPVSFAQYAIYSLIEYEATGDPAWLDRAVTNANALIGMHVERGNAWWYPYPFDWTYYERTLNAPWWSGMAQGHALSLFVRLGELQPDNPAWDDAAEHTFQSFTQPPSATEPWSTIVIDGSLWFEEYAGNQPPLQVLNGHVFAMFGVFDYWRVTGDPVAEELLTGSAATVLDMMPLIRAEGQPSYYCAQPDYCRSPDWQNQNYHPIHVWQLESVATITGVPEFAEWAALLDADF